MSGEWRTANEHRTRPHTAHWTGQLPLRHETAPGPGRLPEVAALIGGFEKGATRDVLMRGLWSYGVAGARSCLRDETADI